MKKQKTFCENRVSRQNVSLEMYSEPKGDLILQITLTAQAWRYQQTADSPGDPLWSVLWEKSTTLYDYSHFFFLIFLKKEFSFNCFFCISVSIMYIQLVSHCRQSNADLYLLWASAMVCCSILVPNFSATICKDSLQIVQTCIGLNIEKTNLTT